jgi:hypothetical protein
MAIKETTQPARFFFGAPHQPFTGPYKGVLYLREEMIDYVPFWYGKAQIECVAEDIDRQNTPPYEWSPFLVQVRLEDGRMGLMRYREMETHNKPGEPPLVNVYLFGQSDLKPWSYWVSERAHVVRLAGDPPLKGAP